MDLQKYLREYRDKFGEQFPMMACLGMDEDEIIKAIKECVSNNKKYVYDTEQFY